jgi:hypothetical protein
MNAVMLIGHFEHQKCSILFVFVYRGFMLMFMTTAGISQRCSWSNVAISILDELLNYPFKHFAIVKVFM